MGQYQCTVVDIKSKSEKSIMVKVNEDDEIKISTEIDGFAVFISDEYYLQSYQKFRDELLKCGYGLKCNGSRINAIQSGMMGYSEKVYLVEMGKQAFMKDVVCIWDYADIEEFPDTKMQLDFAQQWYDSKKS